MRTHGDDRADQEALRAEGWLSGYSDVQNSNDRGYNSDNQGKNQMTPEERQRLKARLIESGFWKADEAGDPTRHMYSLALVIGRMVDRLAADATLFSRLVRGDPWRARAVCVACKGTEWQLASGETLSSAFCQAAISLPEFLRQHPECARE